MKAILFLPLLFLRTMCTSQPTVFEKSKGMETATYSQVIQFYKSLHSPVVKLEMHGSTDAGYPLHLLLISNDKKFDPALWHLQKKVIILINNGIHPGEPDGIDASMMLARDIASRKIILPSNMAIAIIPLYNIGGALNRNRFSRANQDGPESYGFRGNAQNLDLNRDFTKCDTKNARSFTKIFHYLNPDILVDTHVSDGADYQHTMTLITSQYDKLGKELGSWVKNVFDPALLKGMKDKNREMVPYINVEDNDPSTGFSQFYDTPRYSSGYAALFNTIGFMPETHMLKPYSERVHSTYDLLVTMIQQASVNAKQLLAKREKAIKNTIAQKTFPLTWKPDTSHFTMIPFKGFEAGYKKSEATDLPILFYDHTKPFSKKVKYFDHFLPEEIITKAKYYLIPQGWWAVIDLLKLNNVQMERLKKDTLVEVNSYHITSLRSLSRAYEKHHRNYEVSVSDKMEKIQFLKGDYIIQLNQPANRYLTEMLEPTGDDSFFSWNFFDAILQQKEGYSDYRWNEIAESYLKNHAELKIELEEKKKSDSVFARNSSAQLDFIYKNSPYYEPAHLRYPVYRIDTAPLPCK